MTLHQHLALLAAVRKRDSIHRMVDRRNPRHRWTAPECSVCGGSGVLGNAKAYTRCPCCRGPTR